MKRAIQVGLVLLALLVLVAGVGLLVLPSAWFKEKLRQRVVAELEKATGGRVEIARLYFDPGRWHGRLEQLTIHGTEGAGEKPLLHAEALEVDLKVVSFLRRQVDLAGLRLVAPQIRIRVAPDGSTNLPSPRPRAPGRPFTEDLLDLAAGRFEVERGALWWNDQRYPLELALADLRARLQFQPRDRYTGRVEAGRTTVSPLPLPPVEQLAVGFRLLRDRIEVGEITARTPLSHAKARGVITNLAAARGQFHYQADLDAREVADAAPLPELKAGRASLEGTLDFDPQQWSATGRLSAHRLAVRSQGFLFRDVALAGEYAFRPPRLRVDRLDIRLLGGKWEGRLEGEYSGGRQPIRASLQGQAEGIRLGAAGWTALASGPLHAQAQWPVSLRNLTAQADLVLKAPEDNRGFTAVEGVLRGSYQGRTSEVELTQARLSTPATLLDASGRFFLSANRPAAVQFRLQTTRLEEITRAAAAVSQGKIEIPVQLDGNARLEGRLSGTPEAPNLNATLDVSRFTYQGRQWDSLTGRVEWSPRRLRLTGARLAKGNTAVSANVTAALQDGKFTELSPIEADVSVRDTQLQDLAALAGLKPPLSGAVTASLKVLGTQKDARGAGRLTIRRGAVLDEPFDSLRAGLVLAAGEARFDNVQLVKGKSVIAGAGAFDAERRTFRFDARADKVALSEVQWLSKSGKKVAGNGSFVTRGSGRLAPAGASVEELALEGDLKLQGLSVDGNVLGDLSATARQDGGKLRLALESNFAGGRITGEAAMVPRDRFPVQGRAEFHDLNVSQALRVAGVLDTPARISADGSLALQGEIRRPETFAGAGALTRLDLAWPETRVAGTPTALHNAEPVKWKLAHRKLTIEALHLTGEGSDLSAAGWTDLSPSGVTDLAVKGGLNLGVLGTLAPNLKVGGRSTVDARITGTLRQRDINGSLEVHDFFVGSDDLPISLRRGNGAVAFTQQRATIKKLTAEVGGGEVSFSGDADFAGGPVHYRLRAEAQQVRLRYPRGLTTVLEANLTFSGTNQLSLLSGDVWITRAGTRASADLGALLLSLRQPARTPSRNDWLQGAQLNVAIATAPDIRFETSLAQNLQADASLRLQGNALNPALLGRITITQGDFEFQGSRYSINRCDITFSNPFRIDPVLNLDLETRVSAYDVTLTLVGPLQRPNVSYRSDPPLPFNELVTLLAVGRSPSTDPTVAAQQSAQARSLTQLGASSVIGQVITRPAPAGRLQRFFGVTRLKFDPELAGPEGSPTSPRVSLEQRVGKDLTLTYVYSLASAQEQVVRVQWTISKQLSIIGVRDQNGVIGVDFLYKKRYR